MSEQIEVYLNRIIKYGLYAILLTPLAFWPKALFPFLTPKFILFQILVEIVFGAWLILKMIDFRNRGIFDFGNQSFFRKNYIAIALSLFMAVSLVSALFGIDFSRSFWGIGPRMTGLFAELHFFAWFLMLVTAFSNTNTRMNTNNTNNKNNIRDIRMPLINSYYYLNFSFFVSLIVAATAFYQNPQWGLAAGYGIFSNPTFVGPYLLFHFFWGLYQTLKPAKSDFKKWLFGAGTTFLFVMILFAQIRGAVLGLIVGIFALGLGLIFTNIFSRRTRILLSTFYFLLSISLIGLWFLRGNEVIQKFSPIKRVTGISLSETTVQTRLLAWRVAFKNFKDNIFFGTGPENFNFLFNKHYDPRLLKFGGGGFGETWFDKPHNAFLEILTETGIVGGLAYLLIWLAVVLALFKLFKNGQKILTSILASAFLSYLVTVFFSFDSFGSWFGLYLFLAFLASRDSNTNNTNLHANDTNRNTNNTNENKWIKNLFVTFVLIGLFVLEYFNYGIWRANLLNAGALRTFSRNPSSGLILFDKSFNHFSPYKDEYQLDMISSVAAAIQNNIRLPNWEVVINYMLEKADEAMEAHPDNAAYYTDMVKIYNILGVLGRDSQILAQAAAFGEKSLELSPNRQETLYYLTQTALLEGKTKAAVALAQKALDLEPTIRQSHWYLGLAFIANGQIQEGTAEIKKALDMHYAPQNQAEKEILKKLGL